MMRGWVFYKTSHQVLALLISALTASMSFADVESVQRGAALYHGAVLESRHLVDKSALVAANIATVAACAGCHRPSALGGFEGGIAVPPIAGDFLFSAYEPLTVNRFPWPSTLRKRAAYTVESLRKTLQTGITIDGRVISSLMPRYALSENEVNDLASFLTSRSQTRAPGLTDEHIRFATITTPDVSEQDRQSLLQTLNSFFADKNAETRQETRRKSTSLLNKETMYARYKKWEIDHWALSGPADTWLAQLEEMYAKSPVFAILSGLGGADWKPIDDFCFQQKIPCLFPQVSFPSDDFNFYSLYFDAGLQSQLRWIQLEASINLNLKIIKYSFLSDQNASARAKIDLLKVQLRKTGQNFVEVLPHEADIVMSLLSVEDTAGAVRKTQLKPKKIYVLHATQTILKPQDWVLALNGTSPDSAWYVMNRFYGQDDAHQALRRTSTWFKSKKLKPANEVIAANALFAATLAVDSLAHADANFSREYCIEKLEHGLENAIPLSPYSRLSLSSREHVASKGFGAFIRYPAKNEFLPIWITPQ
jgi:hypothetical protein